MNMANYQWYPGHMTKAKRAMKEDMKLVGALLAGIGTINVPKIPEKPVMEEAGLPEACGRLPEELKGVLDFIG